MGAALASKVRNQVLFWVFVHFTVVVVAAVVAISGHIRGCFSQGNTSGMMSFRRVPILLELVASLIIPPKPETLQMFASDDVVRCLAYGVVVDLPGSRIKTTD